MADINRLEIAMSDTSKTVTEAQVIEATDGIFPSGLPPVKVGPVIRALKSEQTEAYKAHDAAAVRRVRVKLSAILELAREVKALDNLMYDNSKNGFAGDASWMQGLDRLVKQSEDGKKKGPKSVKPDPADLV